MFYVREIVFFGDFGLIFRLCFILELSKSYLKINLIYVKNNVNILFEFIMY